MSKIVIGFVPSYAENNCELYLSRYQVIDLYTNKIMDNGMNVMSLIPYKGSISKDVLERCDGFFIPGGANINYYNYEVILYALKHNKPLLGVCMGSQAIAIASLVIEKIGLDVTIEEFTKEYQLLKKENDDSLLKMLPKINVHTHYIKTIEEVDNISHNITIVPKTILASIYDSNELFVPSLHRFTYKGVGKDFLINAKAPDGIIEGLEYNDPNYFIVGVQYHPELNTSNELFLRLKEECEKRL